MSDVIEHGTDERNLGLCAIMDVWSNRIVGYVAQPASFRPENVIANATIRVLAEHAAVDPERLGERPGNLTEAEPQRIPAAPRIVLDLRIHCDHHLMTTI